MLMMYKKFVQLVSRRRQSQSQSQRLDHSSVDLLTNVLPQEIAIDILSRLPVGSIMRCKCVCKSWRDLIGSHHFVTTHHSKSASSTPGLALVYDTTSSTPFKIYDEVVGVGGCSTTILSSFGFSSHPRPRSDYATILSSANGLLCLCDHLYNVFICNPITREYIRVRPPPGHLLSNVRFGFGASKVSGEYKVVVICERPFPEIHEPHSKCMVCCLETRSWRSVATARYSDGSKGAFLNGNLHWLGYDLDADDDQQLLISCFDLETEQFTSFHHPPLDHANTSSVWIDRSYEVYSLSALEGRLCFCDSTARDEIVIWFMNKYGDDNSWAKEFIINIQSLLHYNNFLFQPFFPVRVFKDRKGGTGILLGVKRCGKLFFYSNETNTIREYDHLQVEGSFSSRIVNYNPSFLSLKDHGISQCGLVQFKL